MLEKYAQGELESEEILGQSLTKEMGAISEALGQDGPGELARSVCAWVSPGKGKQVLGFWMHRDSKEGILEI
jgi:hypothetical protein